MPKCSECGKEFTEKAYIAYCEEHDEYFHCGSTRCDDTHSRNKHNALYRAVALINGKLEFY